MNSYIYLKIKNISLSKLIIKLKQLNINLYYSKKNNNDIIIKINYNDYEKIQKYLCAYNIEIIKYTGKIYLLSLIKKYRIILIGLFISTGTIIFLSNFIVDIKIDHENEKIVTLMESELEKYGIKKFSLKKSYKEIEKIKQQIKNNNLDTIEWLEIEKKGMMYIVSIEERKINQLSDNPEYCHITAKKDGIIKSISLVTGEAKVTINDYVKKGDLLISGDITFNDNIVNNVCASGKVYAESWYVINISIPFKYYESTKTGKKRKNVIVNYNGIDYQIFNDRLKNYESSNKKIFDLLGIKVYIKTDEEVKKVIKTYTEEQIIKKAKILAKEKVQIKLNEGDEITSEKVLQKYVNDSTMDIDIFIITKENIADVNIVKKEDDL